MPTPSDPWPALEILAEPTRRRLYELVRGADGPLTRDEVADMASIGRALAAFHLDRLADAGLLTVDFARPQHRSGRGAGRPAKRYAPARAPLELSLPPRRYDFVARILAESVATAPDRAGDQAMRLAREEGRRTAAAHRPRRPTRRHAVDTAVNGLADLGYEPVRCDDVVRLRNCPFHEVVDVAPELVCGLNREVIAGLLEGLGVEQWCSARLDGTPPDCCVTVSGDARRRR
jgi:predicted ArsR family transcriptional regulator